MKKIISITMAAVMLLSLVPTAFAAENNWQGGTKVEYTATANEQYTVTVPATLAPGAAGDVVASGTWGSNRKLTVTADKDVTLTNSINSADQKVLDVTFAGIEKAGDNTATVTATEAVSVADIQNALFGTWNGKFNYNVEMVDVAAVEMISFDIFSVNDETTTTYQAELGMTWAEWVESQYNTDGYFLVQDVGNPEYYLVTGEHRHALDGRGEWGPERGIDTIVDGKAYNWMTGGTLSGPIYSA